MEQKRLLLAIGLSFLVFFLWSISFGPKPQEKKATPEEQAEAPVTAPTKEVAVAEHPATVATPGETTATADAPAADSDGQAATAVIERPGRSITVETPLYRIQLSEKGGAVVSMVLKKYRETVKKDSPNKEIVSPELKDGTVLLSLTAFGKKALEKGIYTADTQENQLTVENASRSLQFRHDLGNGSSVVKTYHFDPDRYVIDLDITVQNGSDQAVNTGIEVGLLDAVDKGKSVYGFTGPSGLINEKLERVKVKDIKEKSELSGSLRWVATERLYFISSIMSKEAIQGRMMLTEKDNIIENQLVTDGHEFAPGESYTWHLSLFMGPKSLSLLKSVGNELDRAIDFGWVDIIAKPCLWFMNFIYRFIPNYGIAIIILTIITRMMFWPLATKSYKSMNDMRKLQPLMKELREKYKDDKARMNQETMALYKTYKINPMGGCLPMVIQLPVFFALYRMLYQAIELRHAPFFGWINDLSAPDRLFEFGFKIPFMEAPYGIPVLTLIMGATMLLQQKMSPAPGDPTQAKMMMLMPIVFTFIFINFPSGLVLYWLISNLVSIAQQYYTLKKLA